MARRARAARFAVVVVLAAGCSSETDDPVAFCDALRDAAGANAAIASLNIDDSATLDAAIADMEAVRDLAPDDIGAEIEIVTDVYAELLTGLAATAPGARGDVLRDMQARLDEAATPAVAVERYARENCSISFEAPAVPTPTPTPLSIDD